MSLDKEENTSPVRFGLETAVSSLKLAEVTYEEFTKKESLEYTEKTSAMAKKLAFLAEKKNMLKTKIKEKERKIEQVIKATNAESESKILKDLEESRIRATEATNREQILKEKLTKTSKLLEKLKYEKASRKIIAEEKEQYNTVVINAAIKYTGLQMVSVAEDTIKFEFKYISRSDPEKIHFFIVYLAEDSSYKLIDCQPPLPTINDRFEKVNADRDLYFFIKAIRKDFVEYHQQ